MTTSPTHPIADPEQEASEQLDKTPFDEKENPMDDTKPADPMTVDWGEAPVTAPGETPDFGALANVSHQLKLDVLRMLNLAGSGHPGGSLGMADVFTTLWFGGHLNVNPTEPDWADRDRFILSNGHICPILYAILARRGYFPREDLWTLRKLGSPLQGHPDFHHTKGVDCCTGSLGNGVSVGLGMALGARVQGKDFHVWVGSSDGESQEGQVWEMASAACHYDVDNLTVLVDRNHIQIDGPTEEVMDQGDIGSKYAAFGWHVQDVDGHNMEALHTAFETAKAVKGQPQAIICHTTLGKGVSFMEGVAKWHGVTPNDEEFAAAVKELGWPE